MTWSQAEDKKIVRMWCAEEPPRSTREIADHLERSKSATYRRIRALDLVGHKGDRAKYEEMTGVALDPLIKPVRVDLPDAPSGGGSLTEGFNMLVWGDVHFPYEDPQALEVLRQVTGDVEPEVLVCLGDVFDFDQISNHRSPEEEADLQETLNQGAQHLADMVELSGASQAYFLGGNHEDRWDRLLHKAREDVRMRQLLQLSKIRRSLDFSEVVGFEGLGYSYIPYQSRSAGAHQAKVFNDLLVITHGNKSNKWATRSMLDRYGKSTIFGHTHRIQNFTRRDLKGQESAWNIGCLCLLDQHYTDFTDWAHGFALVEWRKIQGDWIYQVTQVRIHDGRAILHGKSYKA